jgi:hypothetical protein
MDSGYEPDCKKNVYRQPPVLTEVRVARKRNLVRVDQGRSMDVMFANGSPELDQGDQHEETGFSLFRIQPDRL